MATTTSAGVNTPATRESSPSHQSGKRQLRNRTADRTRWAPPVFLPPTDDAGLWLINLEELPSCVPMVQAALYQLALERKVGEYALPEGASLIACGIRWAAARTR